MNTQNYKGRAELPSEEFLKRRISDPLLVCAGLSIAAALAAFYGAARNSVADVIAVALILVVAETLTAKIRTHAGYFSPEPPARRLVIELVGIAEVAGLVAVSHSRAVLFLAAGAYVCEIYARSWSSKARAIINQ